MRHKIKYKKFGRHPKHTKAMMRNLAQELVMHERIITTVDKAKYLRPLAERIIHTAKKGGMIAHVGLNRIFFDPHATKKAVQELAPRFKDLSGGFLRITKIHKRRMDKAQMAKIEYLGNYLEIYEKENEAKREAESNKPDFWQWEMKILGIYKSLISLRARKRLL